MRRRIACCLGILALCGTLLPYDAKAQEEENIPTIVVTAERREVSELETAKHTTVVTEEDIENQGAATTPDALREEPGVWIQKTGYGGGSPFIRGMTGKHILMLVDGVRLNNSGFRYGPNQYLNTIAPEIIGSIEVVRGPGSVLYGSDALGGVVSITTKRRAEFGEEPEAGIDVRLIEQFASADTSTMSRLELEGGLGNMSYTVGVGYKDFNDLTAGSSPSPVGAIDTDGKQFPSAYEEVNFNTAVRWALNSTSELGVTFIHTKQIAVPRSDKVIASDYKTSPDFWYLYDPQITEMAFVDYEARELGAIESLKANISWNHQIEGRTYHKASDAFAMLEEDGISTIGAYLQMAMAEKGIHSVTTGFEYYTDDVNSWSKEIADGTGVVTPATSRFPDGAKYDSFGIYVRDDIAISDNFELAVGCRVSSFNIGADLGNDIITADSFVTFGPFGDVQETYADFTWGLEGIWLMSDSSSAYVNISRGFHAPNLEDLTVNGDWSSGRDIPNPDLDPETSTDYEVGIRHVGESIASTVSVFYADYGNLIARVDTGETLGGDSITQKENVDEAFITGIECSLKTALMSSTAATMSLFSNAAFTYGENTSDDEPIRRIPPLNGMLGVRFDSNDSPAWAEVFIEGADAQTHLSGGDVNDVRIPDGGTPGWMTLNVRGGFLLYDNLKFTLGAFNLGDIRYRVHGSGLDAPGINLTARIECAF